MGLWSGGDSFAMVVTAPLVGGGGGGGHAADPISGESRSVSLALILGTRVPVGQPRGPIRIHVVCLYTDRLGGDSSTGMNSTGSSSSSSSTSATSTTSSTSAYPSSPSLSPSLRLGDDNTDHLSATGYGHRPIRGWCKVVPGTPQRGGWV
jgi:hypothetical protein